MISLAVSAMFAGCSQEEVASAPQPDGKNALSVNVTTQDFVDESGNGSRATTNDDANRTTAFVANDDAMGVYAFSEDGTLYNNVKFTYNGTGWTGDETLYLYKNATYVAYFPYNGDLTAQNITDQEAIKTAFSDGFSYSQSTPDAYEAADLMMAEAAPTEDGVLNFELKHQFAMVEINVPVRSYRTSDGFEYNAPFKLAWYEDLKAGDNTVEPFNAGKGSFRFIVQPGTMDIVIDGAAFYDGDIPVNFDNAKNRNVTLEAGQFKQYNMKYDGVSAEVKDRDLEPGDYYYSDGSIYPYGKGDTEFNNPPTEGCIGVIFETTTGAPDTEWTHGSVLALVDATTGQCKWNGPQDNVLSDNILTDFVSISTCFDGYARTRQLFDEGVEAATKIKNFGTAEGEIEGGEKYMASPSSTGWYLPSAGQLVAILKFAGKNITESNWQSNNGDVKELLKTKFELVGGGVTSSNRWWSSTESSANDNKDVWTVELNNSKLLGRQRQQGNQASLRAVLSF